MSSLLMIRAVARRAGAVLVCAALAAVVAAVPAGAQERGEEVLGHISRVDGRTVIVKRENAPDVRITITPSTVVEFGDSGDRRLFPNPTYRDLRAGMGVRFIYGTGTPERITVVFVPSSTESAAQPTGSGTEQVKARIISVSRGGREIRADVAGTPRTYTVEGGSTGALRRGDLVILTVEDRAGARVVTGIELAERVGTVTRVDSRGRRITLDVDGQEVTYSVENRDLLDNVRVGQRVLFEVEERASGASVVTAIRRQ